jgi:hypothetical protein
MTEIKRAFGKKLGLDPHRGLFPKAILTTEAVPHEDIEYQYLFSPIEDQGQAGTCVAFGTGAFFEAYYRKRKNEAISVSKRAIYSIAKHESKPEDLTDDGLYVSQGLQVLQKGYILSRDFPYSDTIATLFQVPNTHLEHTDLEITSFAQVEIDEADPAVTANNLLVALYKHGPLAVGVNFPNSWMDGKRGENLPITNLADSAGGHCMAVVNAKFKGSSWDLTLRNSWGTGWANGGYADVDLNAFVQVLTDAYVATKV